MIKKSLLFLIPLCWFAMRSLSQIKGFYDGNNFYVEEKERIPPLKKSTYLSFFFGPSNYLGDLGGNSGIGRSFSYENSFKKRTFFAGFSISYMRKEAIGLRASYTAGNIAGSDFDVFFTSENDNAYSRYKRNLDFRSKINEGSLIVELFPFKFINYHRSIHQWNLQPFFLGGIGLFKFNPQGSYFDPIADDYVWTDLAPLRTEGQGMAEYPSRKEYKLTQTNIPFGFGLRYETGAKTSLSFEFIGRGLSTDYLDDVSTSYIDPSLFSKYLNPEDAELAKTISNKSNLIDPDSPYRTGQQRGNPNRNDFYYSFNVKLSVRISKLKVPNFLKKHYKFDDSEICE